MKEAQRRANDLAANLVRSNEYLRAALKREAVLLHVLREGLAECEKHLPHAAEFEEWCERDCWIKQARALLAESTLKDKATG